MAQPLVISIPHSLGKEVAIRRLKSGLASAQSQFRQLFTVQEEIWSGDRLQFRVAALAQTASGLIDVADGRDDFLQLLGRQQRNSVRRRKHVGFHSDHA